MADPYRVLVTGSRTWDDTRAIYTALDKVMVPLGTEQPLTLVHGDCPEGADEIAAQWADSARKHGWPVTVERHPADWRQFGKRAGFTRNAEMVSLGADACLAFVAPCTKPGCQGGRPHGSHGASHCANLAAKAGIPVTTFTPWPPGN